MAKLESETNENLTDLHHDDIDEDDDQLNTSHKIGPSVHQPTASGTDKQDTKLPNESSATATTTPPDTFDYDFQSWVKKDVKKYVNTPIPKDYSRFVQCHIKRDKEGLTKGFSTIYSLYFDGKNENDQNFLLIARKHLTIGGHSEFFIGTDAENPSKNLNEENSIAKLRAVNISSTEYVLYEHNASSNDQNKQQTAAVAYDNQIFGTKAPRKMIILLPDIEHVKQPLKEGETILSEWKAGRLTDLYGIVNKQPTYDEESKVYRLSLNENRVRLPSHKNFQLVSVNADHEETPVMQFGRIDDNNFALDYRYPLTAVQAFAIALSSFHNRFRA